nr:putative reverse transcriptase domain-containing protein [Tanacetum cinerariifolium]
MLCIDQFGFDIPVRFPEQEPPSPDYVPGPEYPPSPDYVPGPEHPPLPDYVPGPEYPEYLVPSDNEAPIGDQPLPDDASPIALSPGYVADFDPLEEDLEEDPEEDPAEYPANGGDDDDDNDDDEEEKEAYEEEDEHLASTNFTTLHVVNPDICLTPDTDVSCYRGTHCCGCCCTTSITTTTTIFTYSTIISIPLDSLTSLPLPSPPTHTRPTYVEAPLGYRIATIRSRAASLLPLHAPSPPLLLSSTTYRDDHLKADMPLRKHAGHTPDHRVDYGSIDNMDASIYASESKAITAIKEVNERVTNLATTQRQETHELQRQRIRDKDRLASHIQYEHDRFRELVRTAKAGPQDGPADAGSRSDEVKKYVDGLPDMIQGSVIASKPKTIQDAIKFSTGLMIKRFPFKRQTIERSYTVGPGEKKVYGRSKPLCPKCNYHHDRQCAPKYTNLKYHAAVVCNEKIIRIPFGNEILIVRGDGSNNKHGSRLNINSCTKMQKYLLKGFHVFLAHVTAKKAKHKSKEKRLEDLPIVRDFPEVFPEDLPGIPPTRQVKFQIDLIPDAAPVARAPYRLALSKMKELPNQVQSF